MSSTTTRRPRAAAAAGPRKSPLRTATLAVPAGTLAGPSATDLLLAAGRNPRDPVPAPELRQMQISEFAAWLRTRTNRNKRLFQDATVLAYTDADAGPARIELQLATAEQNTDIYVELATRR